LAGEKMTADMPAARIPRIQAFFLTVALLGTVGLNAACIFGGTLPSFTPPAPPMSPHIAIPQPTQVIEDGNERRTSVAPE